MTIRKSTMLAISAATLVLAVVMTTAGPLASQPLNRGWDVDAMMGPSMMSRGMMMGHGLCDPRAAGLAEWRVKVIERVVQPTEAQKSPFEGLKTASAKAAQLISSACPADLPKTSVQRLDIMEKRLTSMLDAMKVVRPAFETFYASLNDQQKARLDKAGPQGWGWRGWRMPWHR